VDLRRLLAIARSRLPLLVAGVILGGGIASVVSSLQPKTYEAKSTLIVGQSLSGVATDINQLLVSQRLSATYAAVATTRPILEAVIKQLSLDVTPEQLIKRVRATAQLDSTLLSVSAQDEDPQRASDIANALAQQLIAASPTIQGREQEFQAAIDAQLKSTLTQIEATQERVDGLTAQTNRTAAEEALLVSLENRLASLRSTYATILSISSSGASNMLGVIEPAVAPAEPISPRVVLNTLLGALLGLFAAAGIAALATYLHDVIRDPDEVQEVAGMSTLGTIARHKSDSGRGELYRLVALLYPRSGGAEAYRTLRANVEFGAVDSTIQTLLVTSSVPGEGKTVTAANLAIVFAQAGREVLLVDADLRKPGVHLLFQLPNTRGLTTLVRDLGDLFDIDSVVQATEQDHLRVLTTGPLPPNPAELLGSQRMRNLVERLKSTAGLIIFDSPPLMAVADSAVLSSFLDGTVLVIDAERSRRRSVRLACMALARAGANILGAALNRVPDQARSAYDTYYGDTSTGKGDSPTAKVAESGGFAATSGTPTAVRDRSASRATRRSNKR
jgi:non-specific protein-tyrosine kinase